MDCLQQRYLKFAPSLHYKMCVRDVKTFGEALWYSSYNSTIDSPLGYVAGHGMSMCRPRQRPLAHFEPPQFLS